MPEHNEHELDTQRDILQQYYHTVRAQSVRYCSPLEIEDYVIQTMADASPPKWHLAHTSWFFETFILQAYLDGYQRFHPDYDALFNSYYVTHGDPYPRPRRGLLSRPTVKEVMRYRIHVDTQMARLLRRADERHWRDIVRLTLLGVNHEQQHQELLLTDIKYNFYQNPMRPAYRDYQTVPSQSAQPLQWREFPGGVFDVGHNGADFAYDNEGPSHKVYINPFRLASRLVSNAEYAAFIDDGGYRQPELWYAEAWAMLNAEQWRAPLYWERQDGQWLHFTLEGMRAVEPDAPVYHVSQYEADAYARWAGKRLPSEFEWEVAAEQQEIAGNLRRDNLLRPLSAGAAADSPEAEQQDRQKQPLHQIYGDVWEWTASPYAAYPGYKPAGGSIGEYNGKFMSGQTVLRGGSFATPADHIRPSYRNFFYPKDRWQFSGIRLADEV